MDHASSAARPARTTCPASAGGALSLGDDPHNSPDVQRSCPDRGPGRGPSRRTIRRARHAMKTVPVRHTNPQHLGYFPGDDPTIRGAHNRGYQAVDAKLVDVTDWSVSDRWAAGDLISSVDDLERLMTALIRGKVVPRPQLEEMFTLPPGLPEAQYGGGLRQPGRPAFRPPRLRRLTAPRRSVRSARPRPRPREGDGAAALPADVRALARPRRPGRAGGVPRGSGLSRACPADSGQPSSEVITCLMRV